MNNQKVAILSFPELDDYELNKLMEAVEKGLMDSNLGITLVFVSTPIEAITLKDLKKLVERIDENDA